MNIFADTTYELPQLKQSRTILTFWLVFEPNTPLNTTVAIIDGKIAEHSIFRIEFFQSKNGAPHFIPKIGRNVRIHLANVKYRA